MTVSIITIERASTSYVADHNANYAALKAAIETLEASAGISGSTLSVPDGLKEIFDRTGIVGKTSYKPTAATLTGPDYNLTVLAGAFWNTTSWMKRATTALISMAGKATDTYYVKLDTSGNPSVVTSGSTTTPWQFDYDSGTHVVSNVQLYAGVSILFDGDDYADQLTSAVFSTNFESVADRMENIESLLNAMGQFYAEDALSHVGLNFAYLGGNIKHDDGVTITIIATPAGSILLTDNLTNYLEIEPSTGSVVKNSSAFTTGRVPLFEVTTAAGAIVAVVDRRTWAQVGGVAGGGGGHSQNTDLGTDSTEFKLNRLEVGAPSANCALVVERGTSPDVKLRWNETTDQWEITMDGTTYEALLTNSMLDLTAQELTKYVGLSDPPLALEDLARSTSGGYETLDLSSHITAPSGVQAVVLGVQFWDATPGYTINAKFSTTGSGLYPSLAHTVWSNQSKIEKVIIPVDATFNVDFYVTASAAGAANLRVFVLGYMKKVIGVGTQYREVIEAGIAVPAASATETNITGQANRGMTYYLKVTETGGLVTGTYDIELFPSDAFTGTPLYQATGIDPSVAYEDLLVIAFRDADMSSEFHVKITNNDGAQAGTFTVELHYEQFA